MAPPASILFPTRNRRDYLAVALASVAPQAAEHGAEIVIVEDDAEDAATRALAERHGARYVALGRRRGHQRRAQRGGRGIHGRARVLPRRRRRGRGPAGLTRCSPRRGATTRSAGRSGRAWKARELRACGREPLPVTALDLGERGPRGRVRVGREHGAAPERDRADRAVRRAARRRGRRGGLAAPPARRRRTRRLRRGGGRRPSPRGPGREAALAGPRAVLPRPRRRAATTSTRRTAPTLGAELRTLAGCVWHVVRRRCGVGITLTALTLGPASPRRSTPRPRRRARPTPTTSPGAPARSAAAPRWSGAAKDLRARGVRAARPARARPRGAALAGSARARGRRRAAGAPAHGRAAAARARPLAPRRSTLHLVPPAPGAGKWANVNAALPPRRPAAPTGC